MFNANNFIKHSQNILINQNNKLSTLHLALGFDDNYAMPAGVAITSIIEHNPDIHLVFHLFLNNVSQSNLEKFAKFPNDNVSIIGYHLNDKLNINPETLVLDNVNASTCIRFLIPEVLKDITDTVIYVDSDIICLNTLAPLLNYNIDHCIAGVIPDDNGMQTEIKKYYDIDHTRYFNAGVMLINNRKWSEENISERAMELINSGKVYKFADQDVLNLLLENKTILLPIKFNTKIYISHSASEEKDIAPYTVILHYITGHKPWYQIYHSNIFSKYFSISPWCYEKRPLTDKNSSLRSYAKYSFKTKNYLRACKFSFIYLKGKIFG